MTAATSATATPVATATSAARATSTATATSAAITTIRNGRRENVSGATSCLKMRKSVEQNFKFMRIRVGYKDSRIH